MEIKKKKVKNTQLSELQVQNMDINIGVREFISIIRQAAKDAIAKGF